MLIGRDETCQIRLASSEVSRHHCVLKPTPEGILARDLDSRNGTFLNESLMEDETLLKPGDILRIGPIMLQVPGPPRPISAPPTTRLPSGFRRRESAAAATAANRPPGTPRSSRGPRRSRYARAAGAAPRVVAAAVPVRGR